MKIRPYDQDDFEMLNSWLEQHGGGAVEDHELPRLGYVVSVDGHPTALGFLRMVEGNMAMAESLVSDPQISPILAAKSVNRVVEKLCQVAKDLNIKHLIAFTHRAGIIKIGTRRHDFKVSTVTTLVKDL